MQKEYYVFINPENGALVLISHRNPDFMFYEETHAQLYNDNRRKCVDFLYEYKEENYIPDEQFIYSEVK